MMLKRDPIACYAELERFLREEKTNLENNVRKILVISLTKRIYCLLKNRLGRKIQNRDIYINISYLHF